MQSRVAVLVLTLWTLPTLQQQWQVPSLSKLFQGGLDGDDGETISAETDLDGDEDDAEVDGIVEQLTSQLRSTIKSQIKDMKSASKLGASRFSSLSELHIAASNNQFEVVERLLASGADPNAKSPAQMTPLHSAADGGYKDIVNILLAHNASIDIAGPHGATPLHLAAHRGRMSVVELLLREGAPVDVLTDAAFNFTPLYMAADMGHARVVALLLAANASTEVRAHHGGTALHAAVINRHESVVRELIDAGADVDARDSDGLRPLIFARAMRDGAESELFRLLEAAGAQPVTAEEEESMSSRSFVRAEVKPFMRVG